MSVLFEPSFPVAVPRKSRDILDGREKSNSNFGDRILSGGNLGFSCWGGGVFLFRAHNANVLLR